MNEIIEREKIFYIEGVLKEDLGFYKVDFDKEVAEDLYFIVHDSKGIKDRIRVKSQLGSVYTWVEGDWRHIKGYKISLDF